MEVFTKLCSNCDTPHNRDGELCSACYYLRVCGRYKTRLWGDNQGLVNRRWSMRFNRRYLERWAKPSDSMTGSDASFLLDLELGWKLAVLRSGIRALPLWETKRAAQTW